MATPLGRFYIFHNPQVSRSAEVARHIERHLLQHSGTDAQCVVVSDVDQRPLHDAGMLLAVGGDGTMLRVGRVGARLGCPVLGFNLGQVPQETST